MVDRLYDVVIIGSGIIGLTIAYELSKYDVRVAVVDENIEPGLGVSKGHAGVIHVIQPPFTSLKSVLALKGNRLYDKLVEELGVKFRRIPMFLVAVKPSQLLVLPLAYVILRLLYGLRGYNVTILSGSRLGGLESNVRGYAAIRVNGYAVIDSFELVYRLYEACKLRGVEFHMGARVTGIKNVEDGVVIETTLGTLRASYLVNAAGLGSDEIARYTGLEAHVKPRRGAMIVFDRLQTRGIVTPLTIIERRGTKGGGIIPTVWGHTIWGPNLVDEGSKTDRGVYPGDLLALFKKFHGMVRVKGRPVKVYAGIRPSSSSGDFLVLFSPTTRRAVNLVGIESPGLTAAPAIALMVVYMLREAGLKSRLKQPSRLAVPSISMSTRSKLALGYNIKGNEEVIVCPCMAVSLADIKHAVRGGARTLEGVIHRTKLAMGACQGQHCLGRAILELSELLNIEPGSLVEKGERL